ncbi:hypothetical protein HGRIS_000231 [Hohenbuehelia grisea]|uniref:Probable cytosolic iron-sulfur protein assembly protein 1 n=1 Tax=Hohenbuehelia grisea TaxID=104357 RepID=A0ABR3JQE7_9AGAR
MQDANSTGTIEAVAELAGHDDRVWHIAWNPTRPLIASCSADKHVRLYSYSKDDQNNLSFNHNSTVSTGHTKTVRALAWAPSGQTLATGSFDANIGIWEQEKGDEDEDVLENMAEWECVSLLEGHETECKSVAYSSTGTLLASCSRDKTVWIWEVQPDADFECLSVMMEHSQDVKCVAWHPTEEVNALSSRPSLSIHHFPPEQILASASYDDTVKLYVDDPSDDWFCFSTLKGHTSTVWSVAWAPGGQYIASASDDQTIRIWKRVEQHRWESVLVLTGHDRSVYSISWGPGKPQAPEGALGWIASVGGDGKIIIWELTDPSEDAQMAPPNYKILAQRSSAHGVYDINAAVWCPRPGYEDLLATAGDDCATRIWRVSP